MEFFRPILGADQAALSPEMYWKMVLPNTPMPKAVIDSLSLAGMGKKGPMAVNSHVARRSAESDPNAEVIFLQKDLKPGYKTTLQFPRQTDDVAAFLPRHVATSIPFSSSDVPAILRRFAVSPESDEAAVMKQTIAKCEKDGAVSGKHCATSLESMVDFAASVLDRGNVKAVSTDASSDNGSKKVFTVRAVRDVVAPNGGEESVIPCHKMGYPYAVFFCHTTTKTVAYEVDLVAPEGNVVTATAVCHKDKSEWSSEKLVVEVLKVKSGSVPICHFLPQEDVVWVKN